MTTNELKKLFNDEFGLGTWPETYEVDHETYANVCVSVIENRIPYSVNGRVSISIGPNNGILFKNVELICKSREMMG